MGLILPQICEVAISPNNMEYYEKLGCDIPKIIVNNKERVKRGTKIKVHVLDLMNGSHTLVKVQCDECGKIYEMPYKDYSKKYCVQKIGKLFCVDCVNSCMVKYNIASEQVWNDKNYVLKRLDDFIKKNGKYYTPSQSNAGMKLSFATSPSCINAFVIPISRA